MSWYIHPSKQLRDDELPPELVVTNRDGSIEQAYVSYDASDQLEEENAKLRELVRDIYEAMWSVIETWTEDVCADRLHELGIVVARMRELGIEVDGCIPETA